MSKAGYALDAKQGGFGLISLGYHASAPHADPITDHLYLVLDAMSEPTNILLPVASTAVTPTGKIIFQFDGNEASAMVFQWRGKLNLMPYPTTMKFTRVKALSYDNLVFRTYANGALIDEYLVAPGEEFVKLPALDTYNSYEFEFMGTSTVRQALAVEDPREVS